MKVTCAGRTDAGVHGLSQVVNCALPKDHNQSAWTLGVNSNLPADIRVYASYSVPEDFNARFSALDRYYSYVIYNNRIRPGIFFDKVGWFYKEIDVEKMRAAAQHLLGEHDFTSFRGAHCQSRSPVREVKYINVRVLDDCHIVVDIMANAFLHNMVRNIVGTLVEVATNDSIAAEHMDSVLAAKDRSAAGQTAPASGLYFAGVRYPKSLSLPFIGNKIWFLESENELV